MRSQNNFDREFSAQNNSNLERPQVASPLIKGKTNRKILIEANNNKQSSLLHREQVNLLDHSENSRLLINNKESQSRQPTDSFYFEESSQSLEAHQESYDFNNMRQQNTNQKEENVVKAQQNPQLTMQEKNAPIVTLNDSLPICKPLSYQKRNMRRVNAEQQQILMREFIANPNWSNNKIEHLAARLQLTRTKVYKWNWDHRNRMRTAQK